MKKSRLFSILLTFCICVCTFVVGIWAAKTATVSNGGSVSFTANGIYAEATGTILGAGTVKNGSTDYTPASGQSAKLPTLVFDYKLAEGGEGTLKGGESGVLPSWKNNNITFSKMGDKITLTITVKNLATDRDLYAQIVNEKKNLINLSTIITGGNGNVVMIPKGGSNAQTFTVEFEPEQRNMPINNMQYSLKINLSTTRPEVIPTNISNGQLYQVEENGDWFINYGEYPNSYAGTGAVPDDATVNAFTDSHKTGETVDVYGMFDYSNISNGRIYNKSYSIYRDPGNGNKYVKVVCVPTSSTPTFNGGTSITMGDEVWIKVEPLQWLVLGYTKSGSYTGRYDSGFDPVNQSGAELKLLSLNLLIGTYWATEPVEWVDCEIYYWIDWQFSGVAFSRDEYSQLSWFDDGNRVSLLSLAEVENTSNFKASVAEYNAPATDFAYALSLKKTSSSWTQSWFTNTISTIDSVDKLRIVEQGFVMTENLSSSYNSTYGIRPSIRLYV